jgi:hypothetical protein
MFECCKDNYPSANRTDVTAFEATAVLLVAYLTVRLDEIYQPRITITFSFLCVNLFRNHIL